MAVHDYHEQLPGFDERQIWHDGCGECEARSARLAIDTLDHNNFRTAWVRAADWNMKGSSGLAISSAEAPLLNVLWRVQVQLERHGWPIGVLPTGAASVLIHSRFAGEAS